MLDHAKQWERFGRLDPYYGVYATEEMRSANIDDAARERFFASGEELVARVLETSRRAAGQEFEPATVLDHGCGVGRLLVAFARAAERAVGVDISPSMLAEARRNCDARALRNVELVAADQLAALAPEFDLVHSAIVLQHIPPKLGVPIFEALASLVRPGGVGVVHVPLAAADVKTRLHTFVAQRIPLVPNVANVVRRRPWSYPHMEMHVYDVGELGLRLSRLGYESMRVELHAPVAGAPYASCTIVFVRA
jgi:SAM-dependent methyltransferase